MGGDILDDLSWDVRRIRQKGVEEPDWPELHSEAEPIVVTAPLLHQLVVGIVQKERPLLLRSGWEIQRIARRSLPAHR